MTVLSKVHVAADLLTGIITDLSPNIDFALSKFPLCHKRHGLLPDSRPIVVFILKQSRKGNLKSALQPDEHFPGNVKKKSCRN